MRRKIIKRFIIRNAPHLGLLFAMFAVSMLFGLYLPEKIPLHWDKQGIADRIGTKYELIFLLPCTATIIFAIGAYMESRIILPSRKTRSFISMIQFFLIALIFIQQTRSLLRAENIHMPIERLMSIPVLLVYAYVAGAFGEAEYLSPFGIKTKWTLENVAVWERTNRLASRLFQCSAALMLVALFAYRLFFVFLLAPPILSFIIAIIYSRVISAGYKTVNKNNASVISDISDNNDNIVNNINNENIENNGNNNGNGNDNDIGNNSDSDNSHDSSNDNSHDSKNK